MPLPHANETTSITIDGSVANAGTDKDDDDDNNLVGLPVRTGLTRRVNHIMYYEL